MKKPLLSFLLFFGYIFLGNAVLAATPSFTYTPAASYTVGTTLTLTPAVTTVPAALSYGTGTQLTGYTFTKPYGMAFDNAGNLYVINNTGSKVVEYNSAGTFVTSYTTGLTSGSSIAIDASNNVYIGTTGGGIYKYNITFTAQAFTASTAPSSVYGMCTDASGNVYVADYNNGYIDKYGPTGTLLLQITYTGTGSGYIFDPIGVQVDAAGNIYTLDNSTNLIAKFSSTGAYLSTIASGLNAPYGFYMDGSGNFYVGNTGAGKVNVYNSAGTLLTTVTPFTGTKPRGVIADKAGNLYIDDYAANVLYKYAPLGGYTITSGTLPAGLTFNSVSGVITGIPSVSGSFPLTVTGYSGASTPGTNSFTLLIYPVKPTISYTGSPYSFNTGSAVSLMPTLTGSPTSFSSSPSLPAGLSINSSGVISGTPTTVTGTATYTISAFNANPAAGTTTITITVSAPAVPTIAYSPNTYTYIQSGTAITAISPTTTNSPTSYAITPNTLTANTGLSFSTSTGQVSGSPTVISGMVTYNITATNGSGTSTSTPLTITVYPVAPTVTYNPNTYTFAQSTTTAITTITPATTNTPTNFTISPALTTNTGLIFSAATGAISGMPTTVSASTVYTVTATNANPTAGTTTITIAVLAAPVITYPTPNNYVTGTAITTLSPTVTGGTPAAPGYSTTGTTIGGTLSKPWGMAVDPSGNIYAVNYTGGTVAKYNPAGIYQGNFITTSTPALTNPAGITFDPSGNAYIVTNGGLVYKYSSAGAYISTIQATASGNSNGIVSDLSGNLYWTDVNGSIDKYTASTGTVTNAFITLGGAYIPSGISVDNMGNIYVIDRGASDKIYKYSSAGTAVPFTSPTLNNPFGLFVDASGNIFVGDPGAGKASEYSSTGSLLFTFTTGASPRGLVTDSNGNLYVSDYTASTITKFSPTGGYYISSPVPPGLSFNNTNGNITGTPTQAFSNTYTVTAYSGSAVGGTSNSFVINCAAAPTVVYSPSSYSYAVGATVSVTPTVTGSPTSFAYTGTLPGGLSFSTTNGAVTGTATTATAATTITVTATNMVGTSPSTTLTITVLAPPAITYPTPDNYVTGTAITTLSPTVTGGTPAAAGYSTTGTALTTTGTNPWGMAVDPSGNIYTANNGSNSISKYNAAGVYQGSFITSGPTLTSPTGITFDPLGNAYVLLNSGIVYKYSSVGAYISTIQATGAGTGYGITADQSGNLYWSNWSGGTVLKYTASTGVVSTFVSLGTAYGPADIQVDNAGNVYVLDEFNTKKIYKYNAAGTAVTFTSPTFTTPYGLFVDPSGNIFIGDSGTGKAYEYNSAGTLQVTFTTGTNPRGLVADTKGNLYVDDETSGAILKFGPTGGYYISAPVPPGLAFNSANGNITGTPTVAFTGSYTVTAYSGAGISGTSNTFVINCAAAPTVVYTPSSYAYAVGATVSITPTVTGSPTSFAYTGSLPAGLSFSTTTGVVSGTATTATAATTITVTATNTVGNSPTTTLTISVTIPPSITYPTPNNYTVAMAIPTLSPTISGGAPAAAGYNTTGTTIGGTLNKPWGMAVDPSGNIYAVNYGSASVSQYSPAGTYIGSFITSGPTLTNPTGITFDPSGNAYVLLSSGIVYKYSPAGAYISTIQGTGAGTGYGITADQSGNLYWSNWSGGTVLKYTASTGVVSTFVSLGTAYGPADIQVDNAGNVYVLDEFNTKKVYKYNAAGMPLASSPSAFTTPYGMFVDPAGNIFIGDSGPGKVYEYNTAGALQATFNTGANPRGLVADNMGNLYVSDETANTITKFTPTGGYYISAPVPPGLAFNTANGNITGTPTAAYSGTFTVTSYNAGGGGTSNVFTIICHAPPTVVYSPSSVTYAPNATVNITPTVTGSPTSFAETGSLPPGLSFSTTTGVVSGTTTTANATYTISVTATSPYGTGAPGSLIITILTPPAFTYSPSTNVYTVGTAISPLTPVSTGGVVSAAGFGTGVAFSSPTTPNGLNAPRGVARDASGNIYVADAGNGLIREYNSLGTFIGNFGTGFPTGFYPIGIVFDSSGNAYVLNGGANTNFGAGTGNGQVYKLSSTGNIISTLNPTGATGGFDNGTGIAIDASNNLYVSDEYSPSTFLGYVTKFSTGGTSIATYTSPNNGNASGVAVDASGNVFVTDDYNAVVDKFTSTTASITFGSGYADPTGIAVGPLGNIYIADIGNNNLTEYDPSGNVVTTISGLTAPRGVLIDANGNLYVTDSSNNTITEYPVTGGYYISPALPAGLSINHSTGVISGTPYAASAATTYTISAYNAEGKGTTTVTISCIIKPVMFSYIPAANAYPVNAVITPLTPTNTGGGVVTTGFGTGVGFGPGVSGNPAVANPWGLAIDNSGDVFVANFNAKTITEYSAAGAVLTTITTAAKPTGVVADNLGNIYTSFNNGRVYKYVVSTGVGTQVTATIYNYSGGTAGSTYGIALDGSGNLYISDNTDGIIWKCATTSNTATQLIASGSNNSQPAGVAVDASGNVYLVDQYYGRLVKYNSSGNYVSTLATSLSTPYGLYLDPAGNFYVGNSGTGTVGIYDSNGVFLNSISGPASPRGIVSDASGNLYVSDYTNGTITKYPPQNGYNITAGGALPPGIMFSHATGTFSGTPTAVFGPATYTITAYGYDGTAATAMETISCFIGYDWVGTTSSDWNVAANWISKVVPLGGANNNTANIGVNYAFTNQPTIGSPDPTTISVGAIVVGNKGGKAVNLTVNATYTLAVTGDITKKSDANSNLGYVSTLAGGGTITAANVNVVANTTAASTYTESLTSSVSSLKLSGNIALKDTTYNASFNISGGVTNVTGTLLTTNVSGSTSTFNIGAVSPATTATLQLVNATPLSTLSATGTNTLSFVNPGATIEYSGAAQTIYTDAAITGLSAGVSYQNIKFSGTGIKTPNGTATNNLNIAGNYTNALANDAADYLPLTSTIVNFNGTTAQGLAGGIASLNYGSIFNTVNFSNAGTKTMSGSFYVASTGTLTMSSAATLVAGDNVSPTPTAADAYLTLLSDVNGAATVPAIPSGCAITGNVNVQRYITGGTATYRGYRMLSSPVNAGGGIITINYLIKQVYLTGTSGTGGGFDGGSNPSLYLFRENLLPNNSTFTGGNFRGFNNITTSPTYTIDVDGTGFQVPIGNGYQMFYRGDRKAAAYATETTTSYVPTADTLTATGYLNQGAITVKNWYDNSQSLLYSTTSQSTNIEGYNLLGNPYASSIDFNTYSTSNSAAGIYAPGTNPFVYILDPVSKNYNVYQAGNNGMGTIATTGSNVIASGQGFFIVANTAGATLTFNEAAKINSQATAANGNLFLALQQNQTPAEKSYLRLELNKDTINRDAIFINFNTGANAKYSGNEDAPYKVGHGYVSLASRSADGISLAINTTPYPKQSQPIPLNVSAYISGSYTLKMTDMHNMPAMYDIWLKDAYLKDSLDIKHNSTYTFDVNTSDTSSYGNNRFSLIIRQDPALSLHLLNFTASKATGTVQTAWTVENEANYTKFSLLKSIDGVTFSSIDSLLSSGIGTYSFADVNPKIQNYYKLQLTDLAGNITYSSIVPVIYSNTNKPVNGLTVYPNPTNNMINIAVNQGNIATSGLQNQTVTTTTPATGQTYDIKITNMTGEVLKTVTAVPATWQNNVSSLLPGTYIIQVFSHGSSSVVGRTTFVKL